jgi:predicted dehydrogenase
MNKGIKTVMRLGGRLAGMPQKPMPKEEQLISKLSRRTFLLETLTAGAAVFAGSSPYFARARGINEEIRFGIIGIGSTVKIGGKGKRNIQDWRKQSGVRVVALCDVDQSILEAELEQFKKWREPVVAFRDLRKMLERKDIDAVNITAPNHWHALAAIWACQAGKDVFVEKPASHNLLEGRRMVEAARKYGRIVLCTSGSREATGYTEALGWVRRGGLGKIKLIYGVNYKPRPSIGRVGGSQPIPNGIDYDLWSGPAPVQPLKRQFLHYDWHWDWETGNGDLGNMGIHYLDGCRMATDQGLPGHVLSLGGRFGYDDDGQTPNTQLVYFDYKPAPVLFEVRGLPRDKGLLGATWNARDMDNLRGQQTGVVIFCEGGYLAANQAFDEKGKLIREFKGETPGLYQNFLDCARSRKREQLVADIEEGHLSAALVHLGNVSYRLGKAAPAGEIAERISGCKELAAAFEKAQNHLAANGIDLTKTPPVLGPLLALEPERERFTGEFAAEANQMASRNYRKPFVVPEKV